MCHKLKYKDRIAALLAAADVRKRRSGKRGEYRAYYCAHCVAWHLTSKRLNINDRGVNDTFI